MVRCLLPLLAAVLLAACADPPPAQPSESTPQTTPSSAGRPGQLALPKGPLADRPWATKACQPDERSADVLACVDGVAIGKARFDAVAPSYPPGTPPRAILQALIDEELLAAEAARQGGWNPASLQTIYRQALVQALLKRTVESLGPAQVADADIQQAYRHPDIRTRYDRAASYFVTDVQILCCTGDWQQCGKRDEVRACIERSEPTARRLHDEVLAHAPATGLELAAQVRTWGAKFPDAAVAEVSFFYDKTKPYDQQKGYDLMVKEFALPVVEMKVGEIHPPIRSPFGWHIPRLDKIEPAVKKPWNDPDVRAEIARNIVPAIREREAIRLGFALMKQAGVELYYDRLEPSRLAAAGEEGEETPANTGSSKPGKRQASP